MLNKSKSNYHACCLLLWKTEAPVSRSQGIEEEESGHLGPSMSLVRSSSQSLDPFRALPPGLAHLQGRGAPSHTGSSSPHWKSAHTIVTTAWASPGHTGRAIYHVLILHFLAQHLSMCTDTELVSFVKGAKHVICITTGSY